MGWKYVVRPARCEDCAAILKLNAEHLECEGFSVERDMKITVKDLQADGFGKRPFYECLLAEAIDESGNREVIGFVMYVLVYCSQIGRNMYLDNVFIREEHRGKGIGKTLFSKVATIGLEHGCNGMEWMVMSANVSARRFYDHLNATDLTEREGWRYINVTGPEFLKIAQNGRADME